MMVQVTMASSGKLGEIISICKAPKRVRSFFLLIRTLLKYLAWWMIILRDVMLISLLFVLHISRRRWYRRTKSQIPTPT